MSEIKPDEALTKESEPLNVELIVAESGSLDSEEAKYWRKVGLEFLVEGVGSESFFKRFDSPKPENIDDVAKIVDYFVLSEKIPHKVLIVLHDGRIIAAASIFEFKSNEIEVDGVVELSITVADEMQGKGIGSRLIDKAAVLAAKDGNSHAYTSFSPGNQGSRDLFLRVFGSMSIAAGRANPTDQFWRLPGVTQEDYPDKESQLRLFCGENELELPDEQVLTPQTRWLKILKFLG